MNTSQALMLIARLAGFRLLVRANRFGCDSDFARAAHDNVIAVLDSYRGELAELIQLECEAGRETDPDRKDDLIYHLVQCQRATDRNWYDCQPFELGGWHPSEADGSFLDPVTGVPAIVTEMPVLVALPQNRLCGLPTLLEAIAEECAINFRYEAVYYRPKPRSAEPGKGIAPFDPDAEIPW